MDVNYDVLGGRGLEEKILELILYVERHGISKTLLQNLKQMRSHVIWPEVPTQTIQKPDPDGVIELHPSAGKTIEAVINEVTISLINLSIGKWELTAENKGIVSWSKVIVVFQPPPNAVVTPLIARFTKVQAGIVANKKFTSIIRPNQPSGTIFVLKFQITLQAANKIEQHDGIFEIPV
jgi:hypothetical protein